MSTYLALSMDGQLDRLDNYTRGFNVQKAALGRKNYGVGLARIYGSGARSILLVGSDVVQVFRPDLKATEVRGVPLVLGLSMGKTVVGIPTFHPAVTTKTRALREMFESDVKQWLWRGIYRMGRWPETCVKCGGGIEQYDEQGVAWCASHWKGGEVPRYQEQLSLAVSVGV